MLISCLLSGIIFGIKFQKGGIFMKFFKYCSGILAAALIPVTLVSAHTGGGRRGLRI